MTALVRRRLAQHLTAASALRTLLRSLLVSLMLMSTSGLTNCSDSAPKQLAAPGAEPLSRFTISATKVADPLIPADPFNKPAVGTRYVAVRVTIRNATNHDLTAEPGKWIYAVTGNGATLDPAVVTAQPEDISSGGPSLGLVAPGGEISGLLIYEVPGGDSIASLRYEDDLDPRQAAEISLS